MAPKAEFKPASNSKSVMNKPKGGKAKDEKRAADKAKKEWSWRPVGEVRNLTGQQRKRPPSLTARTGSATILQFLQAREDCYTRPVSIDTLQTARSAAWLLDRSVLLDVAAAGHQGGCEWILNTYAATVAEVMVVAARWAQWTLR
ncbi:hypothetical protein TSOC_008681 [Tetrabaena socialis]|uniref:Uncharacterized protein n=1 Tax=Tetrabaena socialis TaxID=47790 RepID=A0A2J7ZXU7_9CHLO|nr:hypothetical protein TSOC_008681 [Tetrabaena socialis]|eukprot:PNH05090.1 hypothetical protein TSOC_008681 [Tetrabaena socialis]